MKNILLIVLLSSMLLSAEKQIILGSYLQKHNAVNAMNQLSSYMSSDDKLIRLKEINLLKVELKQAGPYSVVTIAPFSSYVQLLRTLKALETYYDDAYVLEYPLNSKIVIEKEAVVEIEPIVEEEPVVEQKIIVAQKIEKAVIPKKEILSPTKKVEPKVIIKTNEKKELKQSSYFLEYILGLLLLIGLVFITYRHFNKNARHAEKY